MDLIQFLRNRGIISEIYLVKQHDGNEKFIFYSHRTLTDEEADYLRHKDYVVVLVRSHLGRSRLFRIYYPTDDDYNSIAIGINHPIIYDPLTGLMSECFDKNDGRTHPRISNCDLYNICNEEYKIRHCDSKKTDACRWLINRIDDIDEECEEYEDKEHKVLIPSVVRKFSDYF